MQGTQQMPNPEKRVEHYDIDQVIEELEKYDAPDRHMERIILTMIYAIKDLQESLVNLSDEIAGYDP